MCLILFSYKSHPDLPFVVAANRDEFYGRLTQDAGFWPDQHILAGKDLELGGTWLGMTRSGRFAAVTNIRNPRESGPKQRSRGELTLRYLQGQQSPMEYLTALQKSCSEYAGFNLLVGDFSSSAASLCYMNNTSAQAKELTPGTYGLSNAELDTPWPKVVDGKESLDSLINGDLTPDALIALMSNRQPAADEALPNTGIQPELEKILSSAFIQNRDRHYGTRCSSAIILDQENRLRFSEQNYDVNGEPLTRNNFELTLPGQ